MAPSFHFKDVTLLVTHYNRSHSLKRLLATFHSLGYSFADIVVSDDGSQPEHQQVLKELQRQQGFQLITTPQNRGLGHNINKGQDAVRTPYTLYVQEDFVPQPSFGVRLQDSLGFMDEDKSLDIVRFYSYLRYPYLKPYAKGFSQMTYSPWGTDYHKVYYYSDHPHLRRSTFLEKFGRYAEGVKVDKTEYSMCVAFLQNKGKGLFYDDYQSLFSQENDTTEPSTVDRSHWTLSDHPVIVVIRDVYRQVKYNYDIRFMRPVAK